jgi:RNA 2',3'-cyclic 3'-phosphodiesterase
LRERERLRAFLAFEVSEEVKGNLVGVEEEMRETRADVKVVERENLHFTVKFLGEIPESAVSEIDTRVRAVPLHRMEVSVRGLGAFPDARRPRVVWAGVAPSDLPGFAEAGRRVIEATEGVGESDEREYHPHITVARVRSPRNHEALAALLRQCSAREFGRTPITALKLKSSTLTPRGPTYRDVSVYELQ